MANPLIMPFRSLQHVYFDDLDALNILHNVRFVLFMERARGELFNALGFHWEDDVSVNPDKFSVIAENTIRYRKPVRGEGQIAVLVRPTHLGNTSLVVEAKVCSVDGSELFAEGEARLVRLDPTTFRPCPWSDRFRQAINELAGAASPPPPPPA